MYQQHLLRKLRKPISVADLGGGGGALGALAPAGEPIVKKS